MGKDYYEILGVDRDADTQTIKRAYRKIALKHHPDRNSDPGSEDKFKEASEAFQVLSDPEKRSTYDRFGEAGLRGGDVGFSNVGDIFSHFQDIFGDFFGMGGGFGRRGPTGPMRGADVRAGIRLSLKEAAFGIERDLPIAHPSPCKPCQGTGAKNGDVVPCQTCKGQGQVAHARGAFIMSTTCPTCRGAGHSIETPCDECNGSGEVRDERTVRLTIPAGIDAGQTLRLAGQGQPGARGGPPGHLFVTVDIEPDPHFQRDGYDLLHELHVSFPQAALGAKVDVPTLEEPETLKVPAGTQPGETLIVRGAGIPRLDGRGRGNLVCIVQVDVPKDLSAKARELLEELAKTFDEA